LQELCDDAEVVLDFLPPYSPDFNPIEEAFAELKAWMKKNNQLQDAYADFEGFLEAGLMYMDNKTGNHFKSCHILVPDHPNAEV
jgi:DDE superfamily endonuclease